VLTLCPTIFDRDVLPFDKARFVEAFAERGQIEQVGVERTGTQETNHWHRRLLRVRRERPRRRAAEQRDELAPVRHSITLSARDNSSVGSSRFIALAARRLITNSNLIGCSTGRSAGLLPRSSLASCRLRMSRNS